MFEQRKLSRQAIIFYEPQQQRQLDWVDMPLGAQHISALAKGYLNYSIQLWDDDEKSSKLQVKFKMPIATYVCEANRRGRRVMMGAHSLAKCLVNVRGDEEQYGVAGTMLDVKSEVAKAEWVTLLPTGERWYIKALAAFCATEYVNKLDPTEATVVAAIISETIEHIPDMTKLLDELFFPTTMVAS